MSAKINSAAEFYEKEMIMHDTSSTLLSQLVAFSWYSFQILIYVIYWVFPNWKPYE